MFKRFLSLFSGRKNAVSDSPAVRRSNAAFKSAESRFERIMAKTEKISGGSRQA